jgi:hypothetical protein
MKTQFVDLERFLKTKQCILTIKNKDNICCARALVTAKARSEKHAKWNSIRQGKKSTNCSLDCKTLSISCSNVSTNN